MKRIFLFAAALLLAIAAYSQTQSRQEPFEVRQNVLFADGSLDEYTTTEWNSSYTRIELQERYSASGALLEQVEFSYNDDRGVLGAKITRDVELRIRSRVVYQYNTQNRVHRENLVDNRGRVVSTYDFTYDSRGNTIKRVIKNRAGETLAETTYNYDNQNRITSSQTRNPGGGVISSTTYIYDGNQVRQNVTDGNGNPTSVVTATMRDGLEVENVMTSATTNTMQMRIRNEYGQNRELLVKNIENFQGNSRQVIRFEYVFRPRR